MSGVKRTLYNTAIDVIIEDECHLQNGQCFHDAILAMKNGMNIPVTDISSSDIRTMFIRLRKPIPSHFTHKTNQ